MPEMLAPKTIRLRLASAQLDAAAVVETPDGVLRFPAILATEERFRRHIYDAETANFILVDMVVDLETMNIDRALSASRLPMFYCHNDSGLSIGVWDGVNRANDVLRGDGAITRKSGSVKTAPDWQGGESQPVETLREQVKNGTLRGVSIGVGTSKALRLSKGSAKGRWKAADDRDLVVWQDMNLREGSLTEMPQLLGTGIGLSIKGKEAPNFNPEMYLQDFSKEHIQIPVERIGGKKLFNGFDFDEFIKSEERPSIPIPPPQNIKLQETPAPVAEIQKGNSMPFTAMDIRAQLASMTPDARRAFILEVAGDDLNDIRKAEKDLGFKDGEVVGRKFGVDGEREYQKKFLEIKRSVALDSANPWNPDDLWAAELETYNGQALEAVQAAADRLKKSRTRALGIEQLKKENPPPSRPALKPIEAQEN
jgi:hypothetical protein